METNLPVYIQEQFRLLKNIRELDSTWVNYTEKAMYERTILLTVNMIDFELFYKN